MSYIPNARQPSPWTTEAVFPAAHTHSRLGPVSSGSSRNMNRGYLGDPEWGKFNAALGKAAHGAVNAVGRYSIYKAALGKTEGRLGEIEEDIHDIDETVHPHGGAPSLGAPNTHPFSPHHDPITGERNAHVDGSPLSNPSAGPGIGSLGRLSSHHNDAGVRTHHADGTPIVGRTDRRPPSTGGQPVPAQLALPSAGQSTNAHTDLPQARPHPFTGPLTWSAAHAPDYRFGGLGGKRDYNPVGPSGMGSLLGALPEPDVWQDGSHAAVVAREPRTAAPSSPVAQGKRRSQPGMDPRKRGTWANHEGNS